MRCKIWIGDEWTVPAKSTVTISMSFHFVSDSVFYTSSEIEHKKERLSKQMLMKKE